MNKTVHQRHAAVRTRMFRGYHASHADLPPGTILNPGEGCAGTWVYLSRDLFDAHDWAHLLGNIHVYEVETNAPVEKRRQKDALSEYEWLTETARIVRKIGTVRTDNSDYCDGCLAGM